jgi:hypothetical protein
MHKKEKLGRSTRKDGAVEKRTNLFGPKSIVNFLAGNWCE